MTCCHRPQRVTSSNAEEPEALTSNSATLVESLAGDEEGSEMQKRLLGRDELEVSAIGPNCMALTEAAVQRLEENLGAADVALFPEHISRIEQSPAAVEAKGDRYAASHQQVVDR